MHANTSTKYKVILTDKYMAVEEGNPTFEDLLFSTINAVLNEATHILKHFEEEDKDNVDVAKGALFDMMNLAFSNALHQFDPEADLHPELDPIAMLEEENKRLDEALAKDDKDTFTQLMEGDANSYAQIQGVSKVSGTIKESD